MVKGVVFFCMNICIVLILYALANSGCPSFRNIDFLNKRDELPDHSGKVSFMLTGKTNYNTGQVQQENHPPVVSIMAPNNNSQYAWNTLVPYTISVSDKEDGESKYQEISANEVFLEVKYLPDTADVAAALNQAVQSDPPGLAALKTSNCLNCHAFDTKLIGPSFYEIHKRYTPAKSNIALLAKHIREGSAGVWGNTSMPTHPELTIEETQNMVHWILENAADPNINYYVGTEGSFRITPPLASEQNGVLVLTASYTDHGLQDQPKQNLKGQDVVIIRGE